MNEGARRNLTVSLTSFPTRIQYVSQVLESLRRQTRPADRIVVYLSEDQFPGREADLPEALRAQAAGGVLVHWVRGDLKPHKKYYYVFREYPDDLILTVDDDVIYPPEMIERFEATHQAYPRAVAAGRTHLITLDAEGEVNPYARWIQRTAGFEEGPAMQLFAVGVGGVLYDPKLFPPELLDEKAILETCPEADDLWLKAMELAAGIPVVRVMKLPELVQFVPGSQDTSLYRSNLDQGRNDEALARIRAWTKARFGRDVFLDGLADPAYPRIRGEEALYRYVNEDKKRQLMAIDKAVAKLKRDLKHQENQIRDLRNETAALKQSIADIQASRSYRIGNRLVRLAGRLTFRRTGKGAD